jgi:hypothetical protein
MRSPMQVLDVRIVQRFMRFDLGDVDAIKQHLKLMRRDAKSLIAFRLDPWKAIFFETLLPHGDARSVPVVDAGLNP